MFTLGFCLFFFVCSVLLFNVPFKMILEKDEGYKATV